MLRATSLLGCLIILIALLGQQGNGQPSANKRRRSEQQATPQPSPTPPNNGNAQVNNEADAARAAEQKERDAKEDAFKAEQLRQNRVIVRANVWLVIFGGLSFFTACVFAFISYRQWRVIQQQTTHAGEQVEKMQGQLDAMKEQGRLMSESLTQNERAVDAAEKSVKVAEANRTDAMRARDEQNWVANSQLAMMSKQTKAMQDTLAETRRIFELTERPFIIVEAATIPDFAPGKPLIPVITIANRGRTHAKKLTITLQVVAKAGWNYKQGFPDSKPRLAYIDFLAATDTTEIAADPMSAIYIDGPLYRGIMGGNQFCWIYGSGKYEDLSGKVYPLDEYAFSYYAPNGGFVAQHYYLATKDKDKKQSDDEDKSQENPT